MTIWRNIIFGCLAIIVTLSIYQDNQTDKELAAVKDRLDNIHKIQIESSYRKYVQDFIDNDFEAIASHFMPPVNFKLYDFVFIIIFKVDINFINKNKILKNLFFNGLNKTIFLLNLNGISLSI